MFLGKFTSLFRLFRWAFEQNKVLMLVLVILSLLGGILEGIGISTVIPIFSLLGGGSAGGGDIISEMIQGFFGTFHIVFTLKYLLLFILIIFILKAVVVFLLKYITAYITAEYEYNLRHNFLSLVLKADWKFLSKQKLGHLDQMLTTYSANTSSLVLHIGGLIPILANILIYTILAIIISPIIALLTLVLGGAIFFVFKPIYYKNRKLSKESGELYKEVSHYLNESVLGMKTIKSLHVGKKILEKGGSYFVRMKKLFMSIMFYRNVIYVSMQPIGLVYVLALFTFFYKFSIFNMAAFAVIIYAINRIFLNIQTLQSQLHYVATEEPYLAGITKYRQEVSESEEEDAGRDFFELNSGIEFKDVSFSYLSEETILDNVNFKIRKGETVGLIGSSGSGKTTIVDLLLRLYRPDSGSILIDGREISNIKLKNWRNNVGYVSQDIFLINDTIENNIRFYNDSVGHTDLVESAKMANIFDFIEGLPEKFSTIVGERGVRLSGGQRQRIALARVLARKPAVLILDEATSALDNESEMKIQQVIENLKGKITTLVVAHRLSTIMNVDSLLVLEKGKIVEEGIPNELLKNSSSHFYRIYNAKS